MQWYFNWTRNHPSRACIVQSDDHMFSKLAMTKFFVKPELKMHRQTINTMLHASILLIFYNKWYQTKTWPTSIHFSGLVNKSPCSIGRMQGCARWKQRWPQQQRCEGGRCKSWCLPNAPLKSTCTMVVLSWTAPDNVSGVIAAWLSSMGGPLVSTRAGALSFDQWRCTCGPGKPPVDNQRTSFTTSLWNDIIVQHLQVFVFLACTWSHFKFYLLAFL